MLPVVRPAPRVGWEHPPAKGELRSVVRGDLHLHGWVYKIETGEVFAYDVEKAQFVKLAEYNPQIESSVRRRTTTTI